MLNYIGVENFRVFKDKTDFEFAPITILTGKNNSGKSSLNKLLLILNGNVRREQLLDKIELGKDESNIFDVKSIINFSSEYDVFVLSYAMNDNSLFKDCTIQFGYKKVGETVFYLKYITIKRGEVSLVKFAFASEPDHVEGVMYSKMEIDALSILKEYPDFTSCCVEFSEESERKRTERKNDPKKTSIERMLASPSFEEMYPFDKWKYLNGFNFNRYPEVNKNLINEKYIELVDQNGEIINMSKFQEWDGIVKSCLIPGSYFSDDDSHPSLERKPMKEFIKMLKIQINEEKLKEELVPLLGSDTFKIQESSKLKFINETLLQKEVETLIQNIISKIKSIEYLSPRRSSQERVLTKHSDKESLYSLLKEFNALYSAGNSKLNEPIKKFLKDSIELFLGERQFRINEQGGVAIKLEINENGTWLELADAGYGYSQLIPIILKVCVIAYKNMEDDPVWPGADLFNNSQLILEEPEANLHPDFQSKLADVVLMAAKNLNVHFIIETHSEYFIRKLQYLTAKEKMLPKHVVIYYFNHPNEIPEEEYQVNRINVNKNGGLTNMFGSGFFDEATNIQMELRKINSIQKN